MISVKLVYNRLKKKSGKKMIYLEIYYKRSRVYLTTKVNVEEQYWDDKLKVVKHRHPLAIQYNDYLQSLIKKVYTIASEAIKTDKCITSSFIKDSLLESKKEINFIEFCRTRLEQESIKYKKSYINQIDVTIRRLELFRKNISFNEIDLSFIELFHLSLLKNMAQSSTGKYHKHIKKFITEAIKQGLYEKQNPYSNFKITSDRGRRIYLTWDELNLIREKKFSIDRLEKVKDVFLFSCFTGLAYLDISTLTIDHIVEDQGIYYIMKKREKLEINEPDTIIPLIQPALDIIDKYSNEKKLLPVMTNQKYNAYLKEIADLTGITKKLTTHVARHTFATLSLDSGTPIESVSKMLGHHNLKTTQIYAHLQKEKVSRDIKHFDDRIKNKDKH